MTDRDIDRIREVIRRRSFVRTFQYGPGVLKSVYKHYVWDKAWEADIEAEIGQSIEVIQSETGFIYFKL